VKSRRLISREASAALDLSARIAVERATTDSKAVRFGPGMASSRWDLQAYADFAPWRRHMFAFLGPISGKVVLDLGCGYHPTPLYLAAAGAKRVYACDVSTQALGYVERMARAFAFGDRVVSVVCAAEQLPFPDECWTSCTAKACCTTSRCPPPAARSLAC
jgi:SAM-dependent methyltransferase